MLTRTPRAVAWRRPEADVAVDPARFSVIIPTWNEEAMLPDLLRRLRREPSVTEIIVADNASSDDTERIAREGNCRIVPGGLPAVGRNAGASVASEAILLFMDADVAAGPDTFAALVREFERPDTMLVYFRMVPTSGGLFIRFCYAVADMYSVWCRLIGIHQGCASMICVRAAAFAKIGGFDVDVSAAEDVDLIRRVGRLAGGVRYVRSVPLRVSARRFELESGFIYALKCVVWGVLRLLGLHASLIPYVWKRYPSDD